MNEEAVKSPEGRLDRPLRELFASAASRTGQSRDFSAMPGDKREVLESVSYLKNALIAAGLTEEEVTVSMSPVEGRDGHWVLDQPTIKLKNSDEGRMQSLITSIYNAASNNKPRWTERDYTPPPNNNLYR